MKHVPVKVGGGHAWRWRDPIYEAEVYLFVSRYNDMAAVLNKRGWEVKAKDRESLGTSLCNNNKDGSRSYAIWVPPSLRPSRVDDLNTLVHECIHVGLTVLMHRGVNCDTDHEEPYCYYIAFLVSTTVQLLKSR